MKKYNIFHIFNLYLFENWCGFTTEGQEKFKTDGENLVWFASDFSLLKYGRQTDDPPNGEW